MTNTESRNVTREQLAPWDDALDNDQVQITAEDIRELAAYGYDSDNQTLVGLGPTERARRARMAAEIQDGQRTPQSEPPGPFIAADGEDEQLLRSLRRRRPGPWLIAVPLSLVVAAAGVAVVHGFAAHHTPPSKPAAAANARQAASPMKLDAVSVEPARAEVVNANAQGESANAQEGAQAQEEGAQAQEEGAQAQDESDSVAERVAVAPRSATVKASLVAAALPVTLPEQAPPSATALLLGAADVGSLNVTSSPPANVLLDGRPLGKSPRVVPVPPGLHTVLFIHPLYGRRSLSVNVSAGRTTSASAEF